MEDKIYSFLGLAQKAGKLQSGEFICEKLIAKGNAKLVLVAENASENTKKKFMDKCTYYNAKIIYFGDKGKLGRAIGKEIRAVVVIIEEGFARRIVEHIDQCQK